MDIDTSNEAAKKGGDYDTGDDARQDTVPTEMGSIPTPPISASSSRAGSMTTNRAGSSTRMSTSRSQSLQLNPYIDPVPGPSCMSHSVSFHSNIPMDKDPHHILIKAAQDHVYVKILSFKAYNLTDIVRCFFEEDIETDNPGSSLDETLESIMNSSDSSAGSKTSVISMMTKFLSSTIQTFAKREVTPTNTSFQESEEEDKEDDEGDKEEDEGESGEDEEGRKDHAI